MKRFFLVFIIAVALNGVWENIHSVLYSTYKGGEITEFILVRASLFDGLVITMLVAPFLIFPLLKNKSFLIIIFGIIIGVFNEWYGLSTARWAYNDLMPIIPGIYVGLTPAIQLGVLGYISCKMSVYIDSRWHYWK
jgi:uncharacterized protein YacL